jgi:hypothetical protein
MYVEMLHYINSILTHVTNKTKILCVETYINVVALH